jgi:GT2 family glycosyltransferase
LKKNDEIELIALRKELYKIKSSTSYIYIQFLKKRFPRLARLIVYILTTILNFYRKAHSLPLNPKPETLPTKLLKINKKNLNLLNKRQKESSISKAKVRRIALVTAIANNYDELLIPNVIEDGVDYICFTNTPLNNYGIWDIRPIPYFHPNPTKICRFVKLNLHLLLNDYEFVIWKDANININKSCESWVNELVDNKKSLGVIRHPLRDNVFEEADECKSRNKDDHEIINKQINFYSKKRASISKMGLIESNFMVIKFTDRKLRKVFYNWWNELDKFSIRDQLSLPKVLSESNIKIHYLLPALKCVRTSNLFDYYTHEECRRTKYSTQINKLGSNIDPYNSNEMLNKSVVTFDATVYQKITVDVIICVHNALDDVKKCLNSVIKTLSRNHKLIIVNDASNQETTHYLKEFSSEKINIRLLANKKNLGYTKTANVGLKSSLARYKILLNSDTIVHGDWISKLIAVGERSDDIAIIGPLSNAASYQSIPSIKASTTNTAINAIPLGLSLEQINKFLSKSNSISSFPIFPLAHGFCLCIKSSLINEIGYFDEKNFERFYGEENDFCMRATNAGYKLAIATNTFVFHKKSASISESDRIIHMTKAGKKLREIYGKESIKLACLQMEKNPILELIRNETEIFFKKFK